MHDLTDIKVHRDQNTVRWILYRKNASAWPGLSIQRKQHSSPSPFTTLQDTTDTNLSNWQTLHRPLFSYCVSLDSLIYWTLSQTLICLADKLFFAPYSFLFLLDSYNYWTPWHTLIYLTDKFLPLHNFDPLCYSNITLPRGRYAQFMVQLILRFIEIEKLFLEYWIARMQVPGQVLVFKENKIPLPPLS